MVSIHALLGYLKLRGRHYQKKPQLKGRRFCLSGVQTSEILDIQLDNI